MGIAENEKVWVAIAGGDAYGPLSAVEIKQALTDGKLKDDHAVWKKGWSVWKQLKTIPLFAFECKSSVGTGIPLIDIPVPDTKAFESIITPKVSAGELGGGANWDLKRFSIVLGSTLLGGVAGGVLATGLTMKGAKDQQAEKDVRHIDAKNR
jgi:hypothetical protein